MKILGKNILLKPVADSGKTAGGIHLPQGVNDPSWRKNQQGAVVAIGSGITESLEYCKGSRVFVEMYRGKTIEVLGEDHLIVPQDAIVGISVGDGLFHPIGNKILLKPIKTVRHQGRIIRPGAYDLDEGETLFAEVHLLGTGNRLKDGTIVPFEVKVGDIVALSAQAGRDVDATEATYKLVEEKDIQGIVSESCKKNDPENGNDKHNANSNTKT